MRSATSRISSTSLTKTTTLASRAASARARETESEQYADAYLIVEVLSMLFDAVGPHGARAGLPDVTEPAAELERLAAERGFTSFYWFEVLRSVVERVDDPQVRDPMLDVLGRITLVLGSASRSARDRRTSAPPGMLP